MGLQGFELKIIYFVQQFATPFLDNFFQAVTMLGEELFYILIFCGIYWCYNKKFGSVFILTFLFGDCVNAGVKDLLHMQRPIGMENVRTLREHTATGYAFPSGHTQAATTFFYFLINKAKRWWMTALGIIFILLVGLSRIYLGVHWPKDVLVAFILAVIVVCIGMQLFEEFKINTAMIFIALCNVLLIFFTSKGYVVSAALFTGGLIGIYLERKYIAYENKSSLIQNILKYVIGLVVLLVIKEGVKMILPSCCVVDYLRYFLIGFWTSFGAMALFKNINL